MGNEIKDMANELKQWLIGVDKKGQLILPKSRFKGPASRNYNLKGVKPRKFLQHEKQTFGINLGWTNNCEPKTGRKVARWFFARKGVSDKPIRYGETIAIGNGGDPSFIRHKKRTIGINLGWSKSPVVEWRILGGKHGEPVKAGQRVALYNAKAKECLIYFDRSAGGDIGWPSSKTFTEQVKDKAWDWAKSAARKAAYKYLTGGVG